MPTAFPTAVDNFTNPTALDLLASLTVPHAAQHANVNDAIRAIELKLGFGNEVPVPGAILVGNGSGTSGWLTGGLTDGFISNAAGIAVSKLAHVGVGNVIKSNGVANYGAPVIGADIATGTINYTNIGNQQIGTAALADRQITAVKIAAEQVGVYELASGADGWLFQTVSSGAWAATGSGVWNYDTGGLGIAISISKPASILVIVNCAIQCSAAGGHARLGSILWGVESAPANYSFSSIPNVNLGMSTTNARLYHVGPGTPTFYAALSAVGGGYTVNWFADGGRTMTCFVHYQGS